MLEHDLDLASFTEENLKEMLTFANAVVLSLSIIFPVVSLLNSSTVNATERPQLSFLLCIVLYICYFKASVYGADALAIKRFLQLLYVIHNITS